MDLSHYEAGAVVGVPDAPASPSVGNPTNGNPQRAVPATTPGAYWFYQLQKELTHLLSEAGLAPAANDLTQLSQAITALSQPAVRVGAVVGFAGADPPDGWLECDGAALSRTTYANLFAVIGTTFGEGDGTTTFHLPDLRGEFVRGWDHGRGIDPDRVLGSAQADEIRSHDHPIGIGYDGSGSGYSTTYLRREQNNGILSEDSDPIRNSGGQETRPRNVAIMFCIKY